jgi:hypothetical protein
MHLVILVTALLVFGYGQRALRLVLQGVFFGGGAATSANFYGLESEWAARAAGAGAMALTAAVALGYHLGVSNGDRRATLVAGRAATLRHLALYGLSLIGIFGAAISAITALGGIWQYVTDPPAPPPGLSTFGYTTGPKPEDILRFQMLGAVPAIIAGLGLWLGTWLPLQRGIRSAPPDGEVERGSTSRKLAIYLVVFVAAVAVLASGAFVLTAIIRRLLGDPVVESYSSLYREIGTPLITIVIFGAIWIFYRRVVAAEAAREAEQERAANIRRLYTYGIAAIGMTMLAVGLAGSIGVLGSIGMGIDTHSHLETAAYISLVLLGAPAWGLSWWQAINRLSDDERRSLPRRGYLYLALIAGVVGFLIFGSAVLYRLLNAALAGSFTLALWHDVWHFSVDAAVSAGAFLFHLTVVRADRGAQVAVSTTQHPLTVLVRAIDTTAARARLAAVLEGQPDISIR